jgi:hypothetical protein
MLQFLAVLPDGGTVNRFQKEAESYEELTKFIESAKYLLNLNKPQHIATETIANVTANTTEGSGKTEDL